jgi:hypothetical protein
VKFTLPVVFAFPDDAVTVATSSIGSPCMAFADETVSATLLAASGAVTVSVFALGAKPR